MIKITYVWWISFPSTKLAASCYPPSPEPRQKRTLSTLQRKYLNIELTPELTSTPSSAQVNHLDFLRFTHLGPDSLYPWPPDFTHLLAILLFTLQNVALIELILAGTGWTMWLERSNLAAADRYQPGINVVQHKGRKKETNYRPKLLQAEEKRPRSAFSFTSRPLPWRQAGTTFCVWWSPTWTDVPQKVQYPANFGDHTQG
ncbi:hypothetical protein ATANTOWER_002951 [Ataeniobius toweri]|uniref:Uncharacterized protein n=1 Tax=Ataeniobius toweri TaxID=208326 RepID=A0ABU7AVM6_9TELE|nr:hypothetical protein [Ataeniobius toweri]